MSKHKDLSAYSPNLDSDTFFKEYGFRYEDWYPEADRLFSKIDELGYGTPTPRVDLGTKIEPAKMSPFNLFLVEQAIKESDIEMSDVYSKHPNSYGLRSDEFQKTHDGKHMIFAGCSVTFGEALPAQYTWPKIVYNRIMEKHKVSGYYNLGINGATHLTILNQVFSYIEEFGDPDVIFINFPDLSRQIDAGISRENLSIISTIYGILERYCLINGILLISFSWDSSSNQDCKKYVTNKRNYVEGKPPQIYMGKTFIEFSCEDRAECTFNYVETRKDLEESLFTDSALDGVHPGSAEQFYYANFAYEIFMSRIGEHEKKIVP